jgi:hypothetical protein
MHVHAREFIRACALSAQNFEFSKASRLVRALGTSAINMLMIALSCVSIHYIAKLQARTQQHVSVCTVCAPCCSVCTMCVCVRVFLCASVHVYVLVCKCVCVLRVSVCPCARACVHACVGALRVRGCTQGCACVRARVRAPMHLN